MSILQLDKLRLRAQERLMESLVTRGLGKVEVRGQVSQTLQGRASLCPIRLSGAFLPHHRGCWARPSLSGVLEVTQTGA